MWMMTRRKWLIIQVLLGIPLIAVPVFLKGAISLSVTIPVYVMIVALAQLREVVRHKHTERASLVVQMRAFVLHLQKLTQGSHGTSVWAILNDLLANTQFRAQMESAGNSQVGDLLSEKCGMLFSDVGDLYTRVEQRADSSSDRELREVIHSLRQLVIAYRSLVDNFLRFLKETKGKDVPVQNSAPFAFRVHDELADDYDRLMDDARQLGIQVKSIVGIEFLEDQHLGRFRRVTLLR